VLKFSLVATSLMIVGVLLVPPQAMAAVRSPGVIYHGPVPQQPGGGLVDPCFDRNACGKKPVPVPPIGRFLPPPSCGKGEMCLSPPIVPEPPIGKPTPQPLMLD
jgi:hypothetical protein